MDPTFLSDADPCGSGSATLAEDSYLDTDTGNPPSRSTDPYIEPAIFVYRNGAGSADSSRRGLPIWVNPEFAVTYPDPGSGVFFNPGSRIRIRDGKNLGSGIKNRITFPRA